MALKSTKDAQTLITKLKAIWHISSTIFKLFVVLVLLIHILFWGEL
jgi:hypothetical protein